MFFEVPYWRDAKGRPTTQVRGRYEYAYETTAAIGRTTFIRYTREWLQAEGGKDWL